MYSSGGHHVGQGGLGQHVSAQLLQETYGDIVSPVTFGEAGGCRRLNDQTAATVCPYGDAPAGGGSLHIITRTLENGGVISARYENEIRQDKKNLSNYM